MVFNTVVGVISFLIAAYGLIERPSDQGYATVSILNGFDPDDVIGFKGGFPEIFIDDIAGKRIGHYRDDSRRLGSHTQITEHVRLYDNKEVKMVRLRMNSKDAICTTMVTWAPSSNVPNAKHRSGLVVGDLFYFCGRAWYQSGLRRYNGSKKRYEYLRCGWMDADNTTPGSTKDVSINTDVMSTTNLKHFDSTNYNICYWGFGTATAYSASSRVKRASQHMATFGDQVQVSKDLSAVELCDSETSWGPSFYSIKEKILCDMSTKTKIPLCEGGNTVGCFNYVSPRSARNNRGPHRGNHNERRGSIQTPTGTRTFNVTYFTTSDLNGTIVDDGDGY